MKVSLPYRTDNIHVEIPKEQIIAVLEPNKVGKCNSPIQAVKDAAGSAFDDFLNTDGKLLVIVNDGTRPTPTQAVIAAIADELDAAGAEFIIATGAHRAPTEDELQVLFGENLERFRDRISVHDARGGEMYRLGTTSMGTDVFLNIKIREAERLFIIGSVEPHYFAGWTGGRKGLIPGLAAFSTIEQNHKHAMSSQAETLALDGNPVHEDMAEACAMLDKNIFTIMTVLNREQELYAVTAGELDSAFDEAVKLAAEVYAVPLEKKADVVIACAKYPMDIDFYQSHKAIEHAKLALKPGGTLILVSSCRDGIGEDVFISLLASCGTAEAVYARIAEGYRLGYHKAAKIAELCGKSRVLAYTDLDDSAFRGTFIEPVGDLQRTIDEVIKNPALRVVIIPDASVTVPIL